MFFRSSLLAIALTSQFASVSYAQLFRDVGKTIEKSIRDTGKSIEKGAQDTGKSIEKGGHDVGKGIELEQSPSDPCKNKRLPQCGGISEK